MSTTNTYQAGSVLRRKRKRLPDVWEFRYRRYMADGSSTYAREVLGDVEEYPTRKSIAEKVDEARQRINDEKPGVLFASLVKKYREEVLPTVRPDTRSTYSGNLLYLEAAFNHRRVDSITPGEIDTLVNSVLSRKTGKPLSRNTRSHIKALTHMLFRKAMLWDYLGISTNPVSIARVTNGARPRIRSVIVSADQYRKLLADPELIECTKVMMQVAMITGLRVSEIAGLRWENIDFQNMVIHVRVSAVGKDIDLTKNQASEAPVPMHDALADTLLAWKEKEPVWGGWVFGSPMTERPYHTGIMQQDHLRPAGERIGIENLGWHAFRHTHSADLEMVGASDRVQQGSMRHGDAAMTKHYGKHSPALMEKMRKAQAKVVRILSTPAKPTAKQPKRKATGTDGK